MPPLSKTFTMKPYYSAFILLALAVLAIAFLFVNLFNKESVKADTCGSPVQLQRDGGDGFLYQGENEICFWFRHKDDLNTIKAMDIGTVGSKLTLTTQGDILLNGVIIHHDKSGLFGAINMVFDSIFQLQINGKNPPDLINSWNPKTDL